MKRGKIFLGITVLLCLYCLVACKKKANNTDTVLPGGIEVKTEAGNGITYKVYIPAGNVYKGILVMGSGNNENNPSAGSLNGTSENELCKKAAENGYVAAIVAYRKGPGTADWNKSAQMMGEDYDNCIKALATKYDIDKNRSVVGGFSYATFILFTQIAYYNNLSYCKGMLGACGGTDADKINKFKIPVFAINCAGNNEGDNITGFYGRPLFDKIPASSPIKPQSGGITDGSCNTHCAKPWTDELYNQLKKWLP
ncbi:hypothetical protein ACFS6H_13300 [Terrimonas rubra]|uniref:Alpha/beta hydrolase family protein n=1 Tax=Terrimonas rubra TaxID=1035890 RepID=A0ABW6A6B7_9BACT